ncbi:MAG: hypothetical protein HC857_15895, partial [Synechococcales cyanobacterium RU_4_20]|nr:hypothetical protein [Synechococcales cyanobacterium RU_4_20]
MTGLGNFFQKAVYLGVGLAAYAGDKASQSLGELRSQAQTLADELVQRGEMTTEEARRMVDELVSRSQVTTVKAQEVDEAPRKIKIDLGADVGAGAGDRPSHQSPDTRTNTSAANTTPSTSPSEQQQAEALRQQVEALQAQLERL